MIRTRLFLHLALVAVALAALGRHIVAVEEFLGTRGNLAALMPGSSRLLAVALACVALSLVPFGALFLRRGAKASAATPRFESHGLAAVSSEVAVLAQAAFPDVPRIVDYIIYAAIDAKASDIHFDPTRKGFAVRYRIDGIMHDIASLPESLAGSVANRLKVLANLVVYEGFRPQDGRLARGDEDDGLERPREPANFRVAFMPMLHGERIVIRILGRSGEQRSFTDLGMNAEQIGRLQRYLSAAQGMIILNGPTGSGKTTTIYAALHSILADDKGTRSIATLEDPIEYEIAGINQSQVDEKRDFTFDKGLRALLRQDPDVIMVGEIRDLETARIAIQAGMTGHLIITTVHANSAAAAFSRLLEMGVAGHALNTAASVVIAQRLVRRICPACRTEQNLTFAEKKALGLEMHDELRAYSGSGCSGCDGTGYSGRYALYEFLEVSEKIRELVAAGAAADAIAHQAEAEGMMPLMTAGLAALKDGITTIEELKRVVLR